MKEINSLKTGNIFPKGYHDFTNNKSNFQEKSISFIAAFLWILRLKTNVPTNSTDPLSNIKIKYQTHVSNFSNAYVSPDFKSAIIS